MRYDTEPEDKMSANEEKDLKDLPEQELKKQQAEKVKGGFQPVDGIKQPLPKPKPFVPIDG